MGISQTEIASNVAHSTTSFSSWLALFSILDNVFAHHVPNIYVPLYTWLVLAYLAARWWYDETQDGQQQQPDKISRGLSASQQPIDAASTALLPTEPQPIDLTGTFKLISNDHFQELLTAQGVPWFLVKAADKARPTHAITHAGNSLRIRIQGIIESETHYLIGGNAVETNIRGRLFRDQVTYLKLQDSIYDQEGGGSGDPSPSQDVVVGVQTRKIALEDGYTILVQRRLLPQKIVMTSRVLFDNDPDGSKTVTCTQVFEQES